MRVFFFNFLDCGCFDTLIHFGYWYAAVTDPSVGSFPKLTNSTWTYAFILLIYHWGWATCGPPLKKMCPRLNVVWNDDWNRGGPYAARGPTAARLWRKCVPWIVPDCNRMKVIGFLQKQVQIGVLPLGTGNDLARVIGWGSVCDDDAHLPQLLERYEKASVKMLDRSISNQFPSN